MGPPEGRERMNKIVDAEAILSAVPLEKPAPQKMTRTEKLMHLASIVRKREKTVRIYHRLEYIPAERLAAPITCVGSETIFGIAAMDPILREQGFVGDENGNISTRQIMDFFEVTQNELHEFSCDCGGQRTSAQIANAIDRLAGRSPTVISRGVASFADRMRAAFGI
jgi:hypothetical protein